MVYCVYLNYIVQDAFMPSLLTTKDAAQRLGISAIRVRVLIRESRLPATKVGRDWLIQEDDLVMVQERKPGAPRKRKDANVTTES